MLSPVDATGENTLGALHYEGLRRGIIFFAALLLLILPGVVAARYGDWFCGNEKGEPRARPVCASGQLSFRYAARCPIIRPDESHSRV